ncbi:hypothetical protein Slin15195_G114940 [Septoria linicola]|uniref:Uncharacterized protein n=1 Tax=Septoria linicola TaxID=215465 RepID=A0A9Q9AZY5_9PEZI|nr:hypothetical protein Slin15195_G114940 [Septoria linicola]
MSNHIAADDCPGFCCSDFKTLVDEPVLLQDDPLQNLIHGLFARSRFEKHISDRGYDDLLRDACQLVSRLMTIDAFVKHVVKTVNGEMYVAAGSIKPRRGRRIHSISEADCGGGYKQDILIYHTETQRVVTDDMRKEARLIMQDMIDAVEFSISWPNDGQIRPSVSASCQRLEEQSLENYTSQDGRKRYKHGCRSKIILSTRVLFETIEDPKRKIGEPADTRNAARKLFLVTSILHELGHALINMSIGPDNWEPYVCNLWCSEGGFDLENALFGGLIRTQLMEEPSAAYCASNETGRAPRYTEHFLMTEYPSSLFARIYHERGSQMGMRDNPKYPFDEVRRVPARYFVDIFTESFWTQRELVSEHIRSGPVRPPVMAVWVAEYIFKDEISVGPAVQPHGLDSDEQDSDDEDFSDGGDADEACEAQSGEDKVSDLRPAFFRFADIRKPGLHEGLRYWLHNLNTKRQWRAHRHLYDELEFEDSFMSL